VYRHDNQDGIPPQKENGRMRMAEYKDISDLKKQISDFKKVVHSPNGDYLTGYVCALSATEGIIAGLPDADVVEVVHGRWEDDGTCSNCKGLNPTYRANKWSAEFPDFLGHFDHLNYCPNCGAKMDGGNEDGKV
jgi:hypothetical protein